jgi:hypothetical protein
VACVANNESINQLKRTINDANMFSALDHTTDTEETLVKQPSDDIQTSSKPIPKPRKAKRGETTRNKTADEPKTKLCEIRTREIKFRKQEEQMKMKEYIGIFAMTGSPLIVGFCVWACLALHIWGEIEVYTTNHRIF